MATLPDSTDYSLTDKLVTCHVLTAVTVPTAAVSITGVTAELPLTGAKLGDLVFVSQQGALIAGVAQIGGYVSSADHIIITALATTGGYTGAAKTYNVEIHHKS